MAGRFPSELRQSWGGRGKGRREGSFLFEKTICFLSHREKEKRGASSEPTRGWLAPGYNYWLLLVGACRAESRATPRPHSLLRFLVRLRISPSLEGVASASAGPPAQRVCPSGSRNLQLPLVEQRCCKLQLREDAPQHSRDIHGAGAAESPSSLPILCQPPVGKSLGVMKKQGQGCRKWLLCC